jgi:hypothetical protein
MASASRIVEQKINRICIRIECDMVSGAKILKQAVKSPRPSQTATFEG